MILLCRCQVKAPRASSLVHLQYQAWEHLHPLNSCIVHISMQSKLGGRQYVFSAVDDDVMCYSMRVVQTEAQHVAATQLDHNLSSSDCVTYVAMHVGIILCHE